jgi:hypothetical protein
MHTLLLALCLLFPSPVLPDNATVDPDTGFAFPQTVAGFRYDNRRAYGDPRLGYGLNYRSEEGILITVIVYNLGAKDIADGTGDPRVRQQMTQAQADVNRGISVGAYQSAIEIEDVEGFSPLYLRASYRLVLKDGVEMRSHLLMRGQRQHFIKVRASGPPSKELDRGIITFLEELSTIIGCDK